jgi:hypothetical protein
MILIVVKVLFEARLQWRRAFMKLRIELREFTLECCCQELFDGLRARPAGNVPEAPQAQRWSLAASRSLHSQKIVDARRSAPRSHTGKPDVPAAVLMLNRRSR